MSGQSGGVLNFGLVGLGLAATHMMPSLIAHPHARIAAGADPRPEARARFAADFGVPAYATAEQLFDDRKVDVVYIASPHQWHRPHAVAAAERGKHIVVEKPMALTLEDCDLMIEAARANRVQIVMGHTHSFDAPIAKAAEIVRSGELGPLFMINSWNYNDYLYRLRWPAELSSAAGGGILTNQVPHQVDMVRLLGGGLVRSVRSIVGILDPARPTEGSHLTFLQFADGSAASLAFSGYDFFDSDEFHFWVGEQGEPKEPGRHGAARARLGQLAGPAAELALKSSLLYGAAAPGQSSRDAGPVTIHHPHFGVVIATCRDGDVRPAADAVLVYGRTGCREVPVRSALAFPDKTGVIDEIYAALVEDRPPLHDGAWGKATLEVCHAILSSAQERREVFLAHQVPVRS